MIQTGEYTKDELAIELGLTASRNGDIRSDAIVRKLTNSGYKFETCGRGRTYRIHITQLPQYSIKDFAAEYLGITARFEERLIHFLYLLFAPGNDSRLANMPAKSLEWITPSSDDTIQGWIDNLIKCGLLIEDELVSSYYAT